MFLLAACFLVCALCSSSAHDREAFSTPDDGFGGRRRRPQGESCGAWRHGHSYRRTETPLCFTFWEHRFGMETQGYFSFLQCKNISQVSFLIPRYLIRRFGNFDDYLWARRHRSHDRRTCMAGWTTAWQSSIPKAYGGIDVPRAWAHGAAGWRCPSILIHQRRAAC